MKEILVSPSILNADFSRLKEECLSLENSGADWIHCDVMDGKFVPNTALNAEAVSQVKKAVSLPLDVHLMVQNPHNVVDKFIAAGANIITFHLEAASNVAETSARIHLGGAKVGLCIKPATDVETLLPYEKFFDMILIMTVEPGFGGQKFMPSCLKKIKTARKLFPDKLIEVDGGINAETGALAVEAGANVLVAGSFIIKSQNRKEAVQKLKTL